MLHRSSVYLRKLLGRSPRLKSPFSIGIHVANLSNKCSSLYNPHHFHSRTSISSSIRLNIFQDFRQYSVESDKEVDEINLKFAEAREEIESAMESKETVYFNEEAECARAAVNQVLQMYEELLRKLPENEKAAMQRAMGLKIEQLKAEIEQLNE